MKCNEDDEILIRTELGTGSNTVMIMSLLDWWKNNGRFVSEKAVT